MSLRLLSESVYVGLCKKIGTLEQVQLRRDIQNFIELIEGNCETMSVILSGSRKEGFRLEGSDTDRMIWSNASKVLWNVFQILLYKRQIEHKKINLLLVSDSLESPPGFTLLRVPSEHVSPMLKSLCVRLRGALYFSSSKFRAWKFKSLNQGLEPKIHGPCTSTRKLNQEFDWASCEASDFWPPSAYQWIERCHSWPPQSVVEDVVKSGCHVVPIGHKVGNHVDNEWRISFSLAEQKLVYSMNHTQFLVYGLLKLFLKEIINHEINEEDKLLCSYHMKTVVFWSIQQNTMLDWCPQNLLACFWVCFKLLLKWVYEGVCPNFFIPENNLFLSNIFGEAQKNLFTRLHGLYEKGILFLIQSPSVRCNMKILNAHRNPTSTICIDESTMLPDGWIDAEMYFEIRGAAWFESYTPGVIRQHLNSVHRLIMFPLTQVQVNVLQILTAKTLRASAFMVQDVYTVNKKRGLNKYVYTTDKMSCNMLKIAAKFGYISEMLFSVMYYYKTYRFTEALSALEITKARMAQPYVFNEGPDIRWMLFRNLIMERSFSCKIKHDFMTPIRLGDTILYINELLPEQQSCAKHNEQTLVIPTFVLLHMLEFLCSRHLDPKRAQAALHDLQILLHYDQGVFIDELLRDISWEILGICQQIAGDIHAAMFSFEQSIREYPFNYIQNVSRQRIQDLHLY